MLSHTCESFFRGPQNGRCSSWFPFRTANMTLKNRNHTHTTPGVSAQDPLETPGQHARGGGAAPPRGRKTVKGAAPERPGRRARLLVVVLLVAGRLLLGFRLPKSRDPRFGVLKISPLWVREGKSKVFVAPEISRLEVTPHVPY